jgi:hypothetical protein
MSVSAILPGLLSFLVLFPFGASFSFNIDTELDSSTKVTYPSGPGEGSFGTILDSNQDFNGDGFKDLLASSPDSDVAYLYLGGDPFPTSASIKFTGASSNSQFSIGCRFAGDVNKDGYADLIISASQTGRAYLILGGSSTPTPYSVAAVNARTITFTPESGVNVNSFGTTVAGVGDVNKDGFDDFVISHYTLDAGKGACYLVFGGNNLQSISVSDLGSGGIKILPSFTENFGWLVSAAGDINKDGFADFLVTSKTRERVYLFYGGASLTSFTATPGSFSGVTFPSPSGSYYFGYGISRAGDFNGDGFDDLLISDASYPTPTVYVVYGGTSLPSIFNMNTFASSAGVRLTLSANDITGNSLAGGVDYNKDGYDDILIGTGGSNSNHGAVHVVLGSHSPVDSSVYSLGNGVVSLIASLDTSKRFGKAVAWEKNVGTGTRGIFASANPSGASQAYYLHDFVDFNSKQPTFVPSASPSAGPTLTPSAIPSVRPTAGPTLSPSASPSAEPTAGPTLSPSEIPSAGPTAEPTFSPSEIPSAEPTFSPSEIPSAGPTAEPTFSPSASPTAEPTFSPSEIPSARPTFSPSASPSVEPTTGPTFVPSESPSTEPTIAPTIAQTNSPSAIPSVFPTFVPSPAPTCSPTSSPTPVPTVEPTILPSVTPTLNPTQTPSVTPTLVPSVVPTTTPTTVPTTAVPSFRPTAELKTTAPTARSKASIKITAGFILNSVSSESLSMTRRDSITSSEPRLDSVNGATLSPTSQETIKQSIANASQTTVNNVDLVSVTRTNRRLLSSVVHRMLATVPLFSYKVVAEINFNLVDFPGLNESYVAGTKSKGLMEAVKTHEFDRIISYYASINNADQLMNVTAADPTVSTSILPAPEPSSTGPSTLTTGQLVGIVVGVVVGVLLLWALIYVVLARRKRHSEAHLSIPKMEQDYFSVAISEKVPDSEKALVDMTKIYEETKDFSRF